MRNYIQIYCLFAAILFSAHTKAQIINIPDIAFKSYLLASFDTNHDNEIDQNEALQVNYLQPYFNSPNTIYSLEGIKYFKNLQELYIDSSYCRLTVLDVSGLNKLKNLNASFNQLETINIDGTDSLQYLDVSYNKFSRFSLVGHPAIKTIYLYNPLLTDINIIACSKLTNLDFSDFSRNPVFIDTLNVIGCTGLVLTPLPGFSTNKYNYIDFSGCTALNSVINNGADDSIKTLILRGCTELVNFDSPNGGYINNIDFSGCTNLKSINSSYGLLGSSIKLDNCPALETILIENDNLSNLDLSGCRNLRTLKLNSSALNSLHLGGFKHLQNIRVTECHNLNLMDISGCDSLRQGPVWHNYNLKTVYIKNGIDNTNDIPNIFTAPVYNEFQYICADSAEIDKLYTALFNGDRSTCIINSFCSATSLGSLNIANSNTKLDLENNGCDTHDGVYPNLLFSIKKGADSTFVITDGQGNYALDLDTGTYTIRPLLFNNYFKAVPASAVITFPDTITPSFCITPNGTHNDVSIALIPTRFPRPGFSDVTYKIVYRNLGNTILSGSVLFNYEDDKEDYLSATVTPNSTATGQLTFGFSNLLPFEMREITVTMHVHGPADTPPVNSGDELTLSASAILPNGITDENLNNNIQNLHQLVTGSYDPNDKTCLEGNIITPSLIGNYVNYLIRFENTGTANAENIVVTDFIDVSKFDISSLQITSTSHLCKTLISNGNKVQFVFDNIQLPFTEPNKHGYVAFKIKTKNNLVIGDSLKNKADIYFDYNLPVATNTAASRIDNVTAVKTNTSKNGSLSLYPNPSNGLFSIDFVSKGNYPLEWRLTDAKGTIVLQNSLQHHDQSVIHINNQNLSGGIYLFQVISDANIWQQKVLIAK